jgi:hypothetical protein
MSLSEQDQQALDFIEDGLAGSAPELVSLLATFTRVTTADEMPVREKIQVPWPGAPGQPRGGGQPHREVTSRQARMRVTRLGWRRALVALCLAAVIALVGFAMTISHHGGPGLCPVSWTAACATQAHGSQP